MEWDVALTQNGGRLMMALPSVVSRPMVERGLNRARLSLTAEGLLLVPYSGGKGGTRFVELPEEWR